MNVYCMHFYACECTIYVLKYKEQQAVYSTEDNIVKSDIYLQTGPLISQDMISQS